VASCGREENRPIVTFDTLGKIKKNLNNGYNRFYNVQSQPSSHVPQFLGYLVQLFEKITILVLSVGHFSQKLYVQIDSMPIKIKLLSKL
jgi:hypothetical protein